MRPGGVHLREFHGTINVSSLFALAFARISPEVPAHETLAPKLNPITANTSKNSWRGRYD